MRTKTVAAACLCAAAVMPAIAQENTLKFHHLLPPPSTAHARFIVPWTQRVEKECAGKFKFQIYPSMQLGGTPPQLFDQAKDGVVDIIWTVLGYTAGRFVASEVFELPFMTKTAAGSSRALWEYAVQNNLMTQGEFRDVKPLALHVHDRGYVHTIAKPVRTLADFKGLKLRGPTRLTTKMLAAFGATPVGMPVTQVPEALNKSVIDGAVLPWEIIPALKVQELVRHHSETDPKSRALYTATFIMVMNKARYEGLPADARACLDGHSGVELSAWIGKVWDDSAVAARKTAEARGNQFYLIPASELKNWEQAARPLYDEWVKEVSAKGYDGEALLKSARQLIDRYDPR